MHSHHSEALPQTFCWTRFGPEAGESFSDILVRKEAERRAGEGTFYWGIGSAVGRALEALIAHVDEPEVLFSPIKSTPRTADVSPSRVVRWSAGEGLFGESTLLPEHARVTSRWDPERPDAARYALVCTSDEPLRLEDHGELQFGSLRNLCSGAAVGASQVTAVVQVDRARTHACHPVGASACPLTPIGVAADAPSGALQAGTLLPQAPPLDGPQPAETRRSRGEGIEGS